MISHFKPTYVKNVVVYCYYFSTALASGQVCEAYFIHLSVIISLGSAEARPYLGPT